jgi:plastocyanin
LRHSFFSEENAVRCNAITALTAGALAAAGCSYSTPPMNNGPASGHSAQIEAVGTAQGCTSYNGGQNCNYFFTPTPDTVTAGTQVSFKFDDVQHNVVWNNTPGAPANLPGTTNSTVMVGMPAAGTYQFQCTIHPNMRGTLVVK